MCTLWLPTGKDGSAMRGDVFHDRKKSVREREKYPYTIVRILAILR